jgi:HEAT repeat protein
MAMTRIAKRPTDEVDRAVGGIERAIGKLIILLASQDEAVGRKALDSLVRRLQPATAATYLGEALLRSRGDTRLRRRIATALAAIGLQVREPATMTLIACLVNETDECFAEHLLTSLCYLGPVPTLHA